MQLNCFAIYTWFVLVLNLGVIIWGAFVRASGSGAGCGDNWPLCDGQLIPHSPELATIIEFTHRATSGIALLLVFGLLIWAWRAYPIGHLVRLGAVLTTVLIIVEALIGAVLVLLGWVADDASLGRAIVMPLHLVNTFLLLGAITLTGWWASGGSPIRLQGQGIVLWALGLGFIGMLAVGASGALTALGDTLFPATSLAEGLQEKFSPTAHFLVRLRLLHPVIAMAVGLHLILTAGMVSYLRPNRTTRFLARTLGATYIVQLGIGALNVVMLVPVEMQLLHLLLADIIWINLVLLAASALAEPTAAGARRVGITQPAAQGSPG